MELLKDLDLEVAMGLNLHTDPLQYRALVA